MADVSSTGAGTRVALLARPGKAADNLAEALRQAGAELLVSVDPSATDEAALRALAPQALLIALEPSIEAALDSYDALLVDPSIIVIFDEAELAAHRSGWDAQRWARHLSAKLRRDSNVLPPGAEDDADWQPSPGKVPAPSAAYADVDMTRFTEEAVARADSVPADGMPVDAAPRDVAAPFDAADLSAFDAALLEVAPEPAPVEPAPAPAAPSGFDLASLEAAALALSEVEEPAPPASVPRVSFGEIEFDALEIESASLESVELDAIDLPAADAPLSLDAFSFGDEPAQVEADDETLPAHDADAPVGTGLQLDDDAFFLETLSNDRVGQADALPEIRFDDIDPAALDFESVQTPAPKRDPETVLSFEELIAKSMAAAGDVPASEPVAPGPSMPPPLPSFDEVPAPDAAPADEAPAEPRTFSLGELSLAPVEDAPAAPPASTPKAPAHDLSALEAKISSLSLVEIDEGTKRGTGDNPFLLDDEPLPPIIDLSAPPMVASGPPPLPGRDDAASSGVVLIEAGLGGPDPARQLLSSIPADFPATVLVRLHLQGGRYDRLVAQMERASALPVALASDGASARPGTIYFMPDGIGVAYAGDGLRFVPEQGGATAIFAALPPDDSAIVFLSGSDPALVDAALAATATGTLVAAQTPEDCYDGAACAVLRTRGAASGLPVELAGRLAARWPS